MIVKKIKAGEDSKPQAWQISDLVDYIRYPQNKNPTEKIAHAGGRNFLTDTHVGQKVEMIALARRSVHSRMPVTHWVFSWHEGEQPGRDQVEELVDVFLERMGLQGHQVIYGLHHDTENYHLHLAVNRMNQKTGKVVRPHSGFDKREAHKILAIIEHRQGWASERRSMYTVLENGELARRRMEQEIKPQPAAQEFENATGEKSAQRIAQERGHNIMRNALSWAELHEKLAAVGLRFERKGSGAIVWVGETAVKASSVDRAFSMKKLCARLGEFEAGNYTGRPEEIEPEPVSPVNLEEWKTYQAEIKDHGEQPVQATPKETQWEITSLKKRQQREREIKLPRLAKYGLSILNIARHCLKLQHRQELRELRQRIKKSEQSQSKACFETWLRSRGMATQAARWRYRNSQEEIRHTPAPYEKNVSACFQELTQFRDYAKAVNADRYRVTCIRMETDGNKKTFILDKKDGVTRGFVPEELEGHMPEMLKLQQCGENIYYTPLSDNRHHILIDDMTEESLQRLKQDGFRPAVVLQSSPGNFQCILTVPKLGTEFDRDVGNRITERLNREYGDKKLCGCIHPHRAPGFENRKPKHRKEDGRFPLVRLLFADRRECAKALEVTRQIDREYREAALKRQKHSPVMPSRAIPGSPTAAYYAHLENIRKHITIEDHSRVDAMIALRMRANGHSRESVAETIRDCAPTIREQKTGRNWQRYAERTAEYAFGMAGDRDLERNARYWEMWERIEKAIPDVHNNNRLRLR